MLNQLINQIAYQRCFTCNHSQAWPVKGPLCSLCQTQLPRLTAPCCMQCASPLPEQSVSLCGECLQKHYHFDHIVAPFRYDYPIKELIHAFKFNEHWHLAKSLADFMTTCIQQRSPLPDCLIPVPLHRKRLATRGYNQALLLARPIGKLLAIPVLHICKKHHHTSPQSSLTQKERLKTQHAFAMKKPLCDKHEHVMIIDDVMTTGSTLNQLAATLKEAGAKVVSVCCLAKACQATTDTVSLHRPESSRESP